MEARFPQRIICLSDETTEVLYLLGEQRRIVGISCFTVRPPAARKQKPIISSFTGANLKKILKLKPDLIFAFSDLQADIVRELARSGLEVHVFNQRTIQGILNMILILGSIVGARRKAEILIGQLKRQIEIVQKSGSKGSVKPVVYFEEWPDPIICGIGWVSELIEIAGGVDCFSDLAHHSHAANRILRDFSQVIERKPDIIIGSWCGKPFRPETIKRRKGCEKLPALSNGDLYEIKSSEILQPGPAALTEGLNHLFSIISGWKEKKALNLKDFQSIY